MPDGVGMCDKFKVKGGTEGKGTEPETLVGRSRLSAEKGEGGAIAVARPLLVFVAFFLLIKYLETTRFGVVQYRLLGWDFFAHLMMVVFPAAALAVAGRPLTELGLTRAQLLDPKNRELRTCALAGLGLFWVGFSLLPALVEGQQPYLLLPPRFFAERMGAPGNLIGWGLTLVFTIIFCGVGEEVLFRGYIQGQINRELGRPFAFRGVRFGYGLIVSALVFGLGHGIMFYNPFTDGLGLRVGWHETAVTGAEGLLFGFLYEATGGIAAPAALHAAIGLFFGAVVFG